MLLDHNSSLQGSFLVHSEYWGYPPACLLATRGPPSALQTVSWQTLVKTLQLERDGSKAFRSQTCPTQRTPAENFLKKLARLPTKEAWLWQSKPIKARGGLWRMTRPMAQTWLFHPRTCSKSHKLQIMITSRLWSVWGYRQTTHCRL